MKYLHKGNSNESPCLKYFKDIKNKKGTNISDGDISNYKEKIDDVFRFIKKWEDEEGSKCCDSNINSYLHSKCNYPGEFNEDKYSEFLRKVGEYKKYMTASATVHKNKQYEIAKSHREHAETIDTNYDGDIEEWEKIKRNNGNNFKGMKERNKIIKKHCFN